MSPEPGPLPFELDQFQIDAIASIDAHRSVVVAAPTGSGKTVVADHAVDQALSGRAKAFYTTPIKALSNQKFHDLRRRLGATEVGLLTGDTAIAADAPVVVMTTEVLRNMLYVDSPLLAGLEWVVLDEVHYLQDPYRGPVWEEVIIHLDQSVGLVCLSATVSNADELAEWIGHVRGPTDLILETRRPVSLEHHYAVSEKGSGRLHLLPTLVNGKPNPAGADYDVQGRGRSRSGGRGRRRWVTPRRIEILRELAERDLIPAIYFLFSRAGCDDAVRAFIGSSLELTTPEEQQEIDGIIADHVSILSADDLRAVEFDRWRTGLVSGVASHHAGLVPPFKEAVEECFVRGLVKAVFATETLALGINMPARSVVIERLTKFNGETHEFLTPGQYTQLAGRAGRRGIDDEGHAVVLWSPWVPFRRVAELTRSREFELTSAFRPTYNMAVNLVRRQTPTGAHRLLTASFGQFQADRRLRGLERRAEENTEHARSLEEELAAMLPEGWTIEEALAQGRSGERREQRREIEVAVRALSPGDVVHLDGVGPAAVLSVAQRGPFSRLKVVNSEGTPSSLHSTALSDVPISLGTLSLPVPFMPNDDAFRVAVGELLADSGYPSAPTDGAARRDSEMTGGRLSPAIRRRIRKVVRARSEAREQRELASEGADSLAEQFDRVLGVLDQWDYLSGWALTPRGERLAGIYHESDLLVTEAAERGLFEELDPEELCSLVSCITYEHRGPGESSAPTIGGRLRSRVEDLVGLGQELRTLEDSAGLPPTRLPDFGFADVAFSWAGGSPLEQVLEMCDFSGGDFVRNAKQLLDLLRQLGRVLPDPATRAAAEEATAGVRRGVVAASSMVEARSEHEPGPSGEEVDAAGN